ncbi:hypothetical protein ACFYOT_38690 [Saccharothrix saharensis]|uniref:hypothetical protein n=1 Tax=Saccharothrix saharensis TaxID=571190 RepID=UPI0036905F61
MPVLSSDRRRRAIGRPTSHPPHLDQRLASTSKPPPTYAERFAGSRAGGCRPARVLAREESIRHPLRGKAAAPVPSSDRRRPAIGRQLERRKQLDPTSRDLIMSDVLPVDPKVVGFVVPYPAVDRHLGTQRASPSL